jgi:hypothetical protein
MRSRSYTLLVALVAGLTAHVVAGMGGPAWAGKPTEPAPTAVLVANYAFTVVDGTVPDSSGRGHTLTVVAGHGGAVRAITHSGGGSALAFPAKCTAKAVKAAKACPHVVLQAPGAADLNPGTRPVAYGATVLLAKNQTTKGQNVVQKGYSATSSQYKLQVDGLAGRPSCVLVDDKKPGIQLVRSTVSVADGAWHTLECRRAGAAFSILVDGVVRGAGTVPATLSVNNKGPLSVGGKGASRNNDQFQGALDNVWIRIG